MTQGTFEGMPRSETRKVSIVGTKSVPLDHDLRPGTRVTARISGFVRKIVFDSPDGGEVDRIHVVQCDEMEVEEE